MIERNGIRQPFWKVAHDIGFRRALLRQLRVWGHVRERESAPWIYWIVYPIQAWRNFVTIPHTYPRQDFYTGDIILTKDIRVTQEFIDDCLRYMVANPMRTVEIVEGVRGVFIPFKETK